MKTSSNENSLATDSGSYVRLARSHDELKNAHNHIVLEAADDLDRLAREHEQQAGHPTPQSVAWQAQARKIREYVA